MLKVITEINEQKSETERTMPFYVHVCLAYAPSGILSNIDLSLNANALIRSTFSGLPSALPLMPDYSPRLSLCSPSSPSSTSFPDASSWTIPPRMSFPSSGP